MLRPRFPIAILSLLALILKQVRRVVYQVQVQLGQPTGRLKRYLSDSNRQFHTHESRLQVVLHQMPVMLNALDANGMIVAWNHECERVTGYTASEMIGNPDALALLYPDAPYRQRMLTDWTLRGNNYRNWEWDLTCKDGHVRTIAWSNIADVAPVPGWATWGIGIDVTERKQAEVERQQAEAALRQSEAIAKHAESIARARAAELEAFMEAVPVGVWMAHDPHCNEVTVNQAAHQMMQRPPGSVMTATPASGDYPFPFKIQQQGHDVSAHDLPMQQAGRTGQDVDGEFEFVFADGDVCFLYGKAVPLKTDQGDVRGVVGAFLDITRLKQTTLALQESQERLALALDAAKMGSWDWNVTTNEVVWSLHHELIFGYDPGTPHRTYEDWSDRIHPHDRERVEAVVQRAMTQQHDYQDEYRVVWPDGQIRWVSAFGRFHYDSERRPTRMLGVLFDITTRKDIEAALRQRELMFRTVVNTMPQLFWVTTPDTRHEYVNQRWCEYTGKTLEQADQDGIADFFHPDDLQPCLTLWADSLRTGCPFEMQYRLRRASDGEYRWHTAHALPLRDADGKIVNWFGSCTDIHEQKLAIEERAQALERERAARMALERASRMKDEFLAIVSHELRSPLNGILGWARLLRTRTLPPDVVEKALASIERNAQAQTQLIEDLLDISRIIRGQIRLTLRPTALSTVIQAALDTVRPMASTRSIEVTARLESSLGLVSGDPDRLQQIVWNLLSNAVKFTPDGGQVEVRLEQVGDRAQIQVIDSGKGISPDFLPYVFDRFRQADSTASRTQGGLGLGLAIVQNLVELHGGTVSVTSPGEGLGSTFTVQLPLCQSAGSGNHPNLSIPRQTGAGAILDLQGIQLLVVDDEADAREFLKIALEQYGAAVTVAASAQEAFEQVQAQRPHAVLSDIGMPEQDGYSLMRQIRALPPEQGGQIPAIALTAYAREGDRLQALESGFQAHIAKPIEPIQLLAVLTRLIGASPTSSVWTPWRGDRY